MRKKIWVLIFVLPGIISVSAQNVSTPNRKRNMNRIELCKKNYTELFGGEALTGQGTDPEMMDILQKFIFGEVFCTGDLDNKTREMITCITLTTMQTLPQLKAHAGAALNVGVSPVELREIVYLCAPFIGFPRTLNALGTINEVFKDHGIALPLEKQANVREEDRFERGYSIQNPMYGDVIKESLKDIPGNLGLDVARFLTEFCFGDIYTRSGMDMKTRELLVYCILTTLEAENRLRSHTISNLKLGNSKETLAAAVIQCLPYIGFPPAIKALNIIKNTTLSFEEENMVRLSRIIVDPAQLNDYNDYLKEEIEASMRLEPDVIVLYAVSEKEQPNKVTILEIYANRDAYENHIKTPHFQKYKQNTSSMVQKLELIDGIPLIPGLKMK
ncbi:carboxymuconolactone decarboxylase family protein [Coprobacter sp.]